MISDRKQAKLNREAADRRRSERGIKWRKAEVARAAWTEDDHLAEQQRLEAQIAAMIENGGVTVCPSGGSPGAA